MPDFQKPPGSRSDGSGPTPRVNLRKPSSAPSASEERVNLQKTTQPEPPTWNYQPWPVVPAPGPSAPPAPPTPPWGEDRRAAPRRRGLLVGAGALIAIAAVVLAAYGLSGSTRGDGSSNGERAPDASAARPCPSAPQVGVKSVELSQGGLAVTADVSSACGDGDVVTDPNLSLSISDGDNDVAAALFNTAAEPIIVPPGGVVERQFVFPPGMYWRTPDTFGDGSAGLSALLAKSGTPEQTGAAQGSSTLEAAQPAEPAHGSPDAAALAGLRDLAMADHSAVETNLAERWVPQISSKRPGLVAEGITWTPTDILREHLSLRQRYDSVRLVWAGDWSTFSAPDWWVTVVGDPSSDAGSSLQWCNRNGLDADHCYAKIISNTRGAEGTTFLNR